MTGDRDVQAKLEAALVEGTGSQMPPGHVWNLDKAMAALLPIVREYADQRAAEELRDAAEQLELHGRFDVPVPDLLLSRAAALTAPLQEVAT